MNWSQKVILTSLVILGLLGFFAVANPILAADGAVKTNGAGGPSDVLGNLDAAAPPSIKQGSMANAPTFVGYVVNGFLAIISVVFFLLMLYGGWLWMTAQGDPAQVKKAKDLIIAAIIGLVIIGASYGLTTVIFENFTK